MRFYVSIQNVVSRQSGQTGFRISELISRYLKRKGQEMGRDGLFIQYKDGIDTFTVAGQNKRYPAGKVLCDILQGRTREWLLEWPRDFIIGYGHGGDDMIQDNIIEASSEIALFLENAGKNPIAACLANAVFLDCIEKYNAVVQEYPERLESLECSMNEMLYDDDIRKEYLPGIIRFDDMGGFLKACYCDYLADVFDGILFFYAEAAGDTGTSVEGQDELRERFLKELETSDHIGGLSTRVIYDRERNNFSYKYEIRSVRVLAAFEIMHILPVFLSQVFKEHIRCGFVRR